MSVQNVFGYVTGWVQNVMFRQTLMRAAIKRGIIAGATNNKNDHYRVDFSMKGPEPKINELLNEIKSGKVLNSWGARALDVKITDSGKDPLEHKVNTTTVDTFNWDKDVEFYL
ncbi:hypothetical protein TVAG_066240 [Trichomonas vaginalis G3]|uniref:acylphosphatase n=1 Tax=Trichomonas vaginalis (strain ATCC PRA-98 / G3) TaxID=412133 RepID=A2FV54_TRIV3|nr:acylphosphatase family [Trichomonas vaginalis G3]EAX91219.1 hypothetical protein TVAG_066240 [Trichomonas vaginalis G3]KAI5501979.1 acylphosphatase family [Trichomonas vaginalis G3]|eukprot:XP_001304149.1 hypothetical protein [Trichomonas vaginalis G3]